METFCQYCSHPGDNPCGRRVSLYYCTRERGHEGPCVACGTDADHHDLVGTAPAAPVVSVAPASLDARRCVCVRSVKSGGTFTYYSPAVLVERVTKDGRRIWRVLDNRPVDQDFRSMAKAMKAAEEIAAALDIPIIPGARHNQPTGDDKR